MPYVALAVVLSLSSDSVVVFMPALDRPYFLSSTNCNLVFPVSFPLRYYLCPNQVVMSCCPVDFLGSSCLRRLCSSCTSDTLCLTFMMSFALCAMIWYVSTNVRRNAAHSFFVILSISRTVCMRVIIPLLQFPVHARAASVHLRSLCKTPVRSENRCPFSVPCIPSNFA